MTLDLTGVCAGVCTLLCVLSLYSAFAKSALASTASFHRPFLCEKKNITDIKINTETGTVLTVNYSDKAKQFMSG